MPYLQPLLMFTSDNNAKYNMLARARYADNSTRLKTLLAVAGNAALSTAVTVGSGYGLTKLGRAIGGNGTPDDEEKLKHDLGWGVLRDLGQTVYGGDKLVDFIKARMADKPQPGGGGTDLATPAERNTSDAIDFISDGIKSLYKAAESKDASAGEAKAYQKALTAGGKLITSPLVGNPASVIINSIRKVWSAAHETAPDPRDVKLKQQAAASRAFREGLPAKVTGLLAERAKLESRGLANMTDLEKERANKLRRIKFLYEQVNEWRKKGNPAEVESRMKELRAEADKL